MWGVGVWDGVASVASLCGGEDWDVWMPHPHLQKKKSGAPSNYPGARLFYLSTYQTKSNPDMRNSKLAHTQAGF